MKILLFEDSRVLRLTNQRALTNAGYQVISAEDGETALQYARNEKPDLILLDLLLPKISGLEKLRHPRAGTQSNRASPRRGHLPHQSQTGHKLLTHSREQTLEELLALAFLTSQLYSISRTFACYEIVDQYDQRHDRQGVNDRSRQMQNETEQPENQ